MGYVVTAPFLQFKGLPGRREHAWHPWIVMALDLNGIGFDGMRGTLGL